MHESFAKSAQAPQPRWYRLTIRRMMALVVVAALGAGLVRAVGSAREAARRSQCVNNLKQIGLALHNYHSSYECFPPAYANGPDGKPWHSWRILIGPFLEANSLWNSYNYNEPWNGPNNARWIFPCGVYRCPSDRDDASISTNYFMVIGPGTAFPGAGTTRMSDVHDGTADTIAVVECVGLDVPWTEPRDLDFNQLSFLLNDPKRPGPSSWHTTGVNVLFLDGRVMALKSNVTPAQLKAMFTIDGNDDTGTK
jgi:prepilin-type processing-associated H-X9-DG protein